MGTYKWEKSDDGYSMLIIEVLGKRWNYGGLVLNSIERHIIQNPQINVDELLELEKEHFSNIEMRDLTEEFEILKQTPEFHRLMNS